MLRHAPQGFLLIGIPQQSYEKSSFKCDALSVQHSAVAVPVVYLICNVGIILNLE